MEFSSQFAEQLRLAEEGDPYAQTYIGESYLNGLDVEKDYALAVIWFRRSADQGDAEGQYYLGWMYANGTGLPKDAEEAAEWFRKAGEQGHPDAQNCLGEMYLAGKGVPEDTHEAARWFCIAANLGHASAQRHLGRMYAEGIGVVKNIGTAFKWIRKSAEQGDADGQYLLGLTYSRGIGVQVDAVEAVKWYRKASNQGHVMAQFTLGRCYADGTGVSVSNAEAVKWYHKAAEGGHSVAQLFLGQMYADGIGVEKDSVTARNWVRKAVSTLTAGSVKNPSSEKLKELLDTALAELERISATMLAGALQKLDRLVGLESVKAQVRGLIDFMDVQRKRDAAGLKSVGVSLHLVFTGNPGTGKTTVARYLGEIYAAMGILPRGHLIEAHREDLVAGYIGQTAIKTKAKIEVALDGVLFIDEAYALNVRHTTNEDFGSEAVTTLLAAMENNRERLAVIVAGYPTEMKRFIEMNPGLRSRFTRYIEFEDYQPSELTQIFTQLADDQDYRLSEGARSRLAAHMTLAYASRGRDFGNGRYVRNVFEASVERHAKRVKQFGLTDHESLRTLTEADLDV